MSLSRLLQLAASPLSGFAVLWLACGLGLAGAALAADPPPAHLDDPVYGFSVDLPAIGDAKNALNVQRIVVLGPAHDGFSPNCNVQIQFTSMDIDAYLELTSKQLAAAGFELLESKRRPVSGLPAAVIDYTGSPSGRPLHFMALAVAGSDRVWLVTCTALRDSIAQHRPAFTQVIESFVVRAPQSSSEPR